MSALITPTGTLVTDAPPESEEWFQARREGITGTDLPKILGYSKYGNALSVWMNKRGELEDDEAGEAARWGTLLEGVIADEWSEMNDCYVEPVGVLAHQAYPWRRVSLDRLVQHCPDEGPVTDEGQPMMMCGLEVKTRSAFKAADWRDGIPDDVLAQVQWGIHVAGFDHMHVAALIGGQRLVSFRADRDVQIIDYLVENAQRVWDAVVNGFPPEAAPDADGVLIALLDKVYRERGGERPVDREAAEKWVAQYEEGAELATTGKRMQEEAKSALVQLLEDGDTAVVDEAPWYTYKRPTPADRMLTDDLRRFKADQPTEYAALVERGYITTSDPSPRFAMKNRST